MKLTEGQVAAREELQDTMDSIDILDGARGISNTDGQNFIESYLNGDFDDMEEEDF